LALKIRLRQKEKKEAVLCFVVYEKKERCFCNTIKKSSTKNNAFSYYGNKFFIQVFVIYFAFGIIFGCSCLILDI
jgi:hypothetical protein